MHQVAAECAVLLMLWSCVVHACCFFTLDSSLWVSLSRLVGVETSGSDMTQVLQNSWLCSYLRGHLMLEPSEISFVSIDNIPPTCTPRKGCC